MSSMLEFSIKSWSAWAPGMESYGDWEKWAFHSAFPFFFDGPPAPKVSFLPAMLRRRCSNLTKMSAEVAYRCLSEVELSRVSTVFASRNGESQKTQQLLESLARGEELSPMAFSLSVHNSASGIFSIAAQNKEPSTSVAAGKSTFCYALLESLGQLSRIDTTAVMLVVGEELVAEAFVDAVEYPQLSFALALLLYQSDFDDQISVSFFPAEGAAPQSSPLPQPLSFIKWLLADEEDLLLQEQEKGQIWRFGKREHNWRSLFGEKLVEMP